MAGHTRFMHRPPWVRDMAPAELAARYRAGASLDDLAVLSGRSAKTVREALARHGAEIRPQRAGHPGIDPTRYVAKT